MKTVTLINRSGRCLAFNLPHRAVCTAATCLCIRPAEPRGRALCRALTLPAGHAATGLPEVVLAAPEVRAAIGRGELEVLRKEAAAEPVGSPKSEPATKRARPKRGESR